MLFVCLAIMRDGNIPCNSQFNNWRVRWLLLYYIYIFFFFFFTYQQSIWERLAVLAHALHLHFDNQGQGIFLRIIDEIDSGKTPMARQRVIHAVWWWWWWKMKNENNFQKTKFQCNGQAIVIVVHQVPNIFLVSVPLFVDISRWNSPAPSIIIIIAAHG